MKRFITGIAAAIVVSGVQAAEPQTNPAADQKKQQEQWMQDCVAREQQRNHSSSQASATTMCRDQLGSGSNAAHAPGAVPTVRPANGAASQPTGAAGLGTQPGAPATSTPAASPSATSTPATSTAPASAAPAANGNAVSGASSSGNTGAR